MRLHSKTDWGMRGYSRLLKNSKIAECRRLKPALDIKVRDLDATFKRRSTRTERC